MIGHLRSSSDRIDKFSFDSIYLLMVNKSIDLLDTIIYLQYTLYFFKYYYSYYLYNNYFIF